MGRDCHMICVTSIKEGPSMRWSVCMACTLPLLDAALPPAAL